MKNILRTALTLLVLLPVAGAEAQSLGDRLKSGANKVQRGVSGAGKAIGNTVDSTVDLFSDKETPEATRAMLDTMANDTLSRLFDEKPEARTLYESGSGYAVFDTRKLVLVGLAAGAGRGVAVSSDDMQRVYMNMGTAGVGLSLGIGGFESQIVFFFQDDADFNDFVTNGYDATAEAGSMFGDDKNDLGVRFQNGRAVFVLTKQGWKISATAAGTRYWADSDLN
jgi:hypothetical protein